uniref:hypothetical protein n=1 Tax=Pectinatus frisingensis TaxID=865 RepID=UPI0018C4E440
MKRHIISLIISMLVIFTASTALAYQPYAQYLNGDPNFKLCDGHMGIAWYVDLSSLNVNLYNPPEYIIGVNIVSANADNNYAVEKIMTYRFKYNYDQQAMYVENPETGAWKYIPNDGGWADTGVVQPAGMIAFYQAY